MTAAEAAYATRAEVIARPEQEQSEEWRYIYRLALMAGMSLYLPLGELTSAAQSAAATATKLTTPTVEGE